MYKKRKISNHLQRLVELYPAVLITGPRQTGKSTLCEMHFPEYRRVNFDDEAMIRMAKTDPTMFVNNFPPPVVYDEVQRAGEVFLSVKGFIDQKSNNQKGQFILTGSSPFSLMKGVSDSLAGRIGIVELLPMTLSEVQASTKSISFKDFVDGDITVGEIYPFHSPITEILFRGGLPQLALHEHSPTQDELVIRMGNYVQTYLHRDLRDLSLVKDLIEFERFLRRFALSSGTTQGMQDWAGSLGIPRSTLQSWLGLLQASYLAFEVPAFARRLSRREKKASKYFFFDSGLMNFLLGYRSQDQLLHSPLNGQVFETYAHQILRAWIQRDGMRPLLYHWRLDETNEVDFVIELHTDEWIAVEVKMTSNPTQEDLGGIKSFMKHYKECKRGIVLSCMDKVAYLDEKILNIPVSAL